MPINQNNLKVVAILQARMGSSRMKGKVLLPLIGQPVLKHITRRLERTEGIDEIVVATTTNEEDDAIINWCNRNSIKYYRGSEKNVLERVYMAAKENKADVIVEVTCDCPCVDPNLTDLCIRAVVDRGFDYSSNVIFRSYARGLDVQVFTIEALERTYNEVDNDVDRQHVSTWMYRNPKSKKTFKKYNLYAKDHKSADLRLTLDTEEDYKLLQEVFHRFGHNRFNYKDIHILFNIAPELRLYNSHIVQKDYEQELQNWYDEHNEE